MGVPKFFRYISERYPCLSEVLKEYQIPEFDNLYLDMNGIVHTCSHPKDNDALLRITEEEIFKNIFHYVEVLFRMIQPQKLFFMAVDGIAPRAKINQQRGRRFRTAKETEIQEQKARSMGYKLPEGKKFDSNCITPGTVFMSNLNKQLRYFITHKISTDRLWQKCKVIYSGSEVPGEGEHKIMDYIRYLKAQPDYDVNTRHCLYGLDADLIMLALCTHEIHFSLLREEVKFGKRQTKILTVEETKFCLLHIRNDFIPSLPNLYIANAALPLLYHAYMDTLPTLEGYINEAGTLNLNRFEKFMARLSRLDMQQFNEQYADLKYFESKTGRRPNESERHIYRKSDNISDEAASPEKVQNKDLEALIKSTNEMSLGTSDEDDVADDESDSDIYNMEFVQHKRDYYMNKLQYENVDADVLRSQAEGYVRAIQWNLHYYYNGCCSWSWYYPHHYAPYISDIKDFKDLNLEFELATPFLPFQQLLAVLPAYSKELLPTAFQHLLTEEESPIIDYYPAEFKTDLNGKKQDWEAVILIPFIDEKQLLNAMEPHYPKLTAAEQERNRHGPMSLYTYTTEHMGVCKAPDYFPDIDSYAKVELIRHEDIFVPQDKLVRGLCPSVRTDVFFPGFPTFQHLSYTTTLENANVKVFDHPSRNENMILHLLPKPMPDFKSIAVELLNKTIYVNWPLLIEGLVVAVSNNYYKLSLIKPEYGCTDDNMREEEMKNVAIKQFHIQKKNITEVYNNRLGIDIGETEIIVYVKTLVGIKYTLESQGKVTFEKEWQGVPVPYAYQTIVKDITSFSVDTLKYNNINEVFTPGSICFMLGHPHYASMGEVLEPSVNEETGSIRISIKITPELSLEKIKKCQAKLKIPYMHGSIAAQRLGISSYFLSKITGVIYVTQSSADQKEISKFNIGLNLKFTKKNKETFGYTRKENGQWLYSVKTINLIRKYMTLYPVLFERLAENVNNDIFDGDTLFTKGVVELNDVVTWLKDECKDMESVPCGMDILDATIVNEIEQEVDALMENKNAQTRHVLLQVKPNLLLKPELHLCKLPPDPESHHYLLNRVCCIRDCFTVPLGYKGTIVGIQRAETIMDTTYIILFDQPFPGGSLINGSSKPCAYRLSAADFLNITYGESITNSQKSGPSHESTDLPKSWRSFNLRPEPCRSESAFASFNKVGNNSMKAFTPPPIAVKKSEKANQVVDVVLRPETPKWKQNLHGPATKVQKNAVPPRTNASSQKSAIKPVSEFQALWNELHNIQKSTKSAQKLPSTVMSTKGNVNKNTDESPPQDPSAYLKAMLKISNDRVSQVAKPVSTTECKSKPVETRETTEASLSHARQSEKRRDVKNSAWYCSQLLNHFQLSGVGLPRYSYLTDGKSNLVRSYILLPDARVIVGEPCASHAEAAENAAEKVYMELNLGNIRPNVKIPLPLPQQWFNAQNNSWQQNTKPPMGVPFSPEVYQVPRRQASNSHEWHSGMQPDKSYNQQITYKHRAASQENWRKPEIKNSTSFVPLQAQKKSRNTNAEQTTKKVHQSAKDNSGTQKRANTSPKTLKAEASITTSTEKQIPAIVSSQSSQKSQENRNRRKSRIAAKFCTPLQTQGNCSKNST
ncbi:hypothetical protein KM043_012607 [Ampulex compressa]|nr:hypothetical protein KM043_012607 [Ampulex compressa]